MKSDFRPWSNRHIVGYPVHVPDSPDFDAPPDSLEYLGTKRKFWFTRGENRFLFKAEERGTGEDWAEKVVCELAGLLGLPHVNYELANFSSENLPRVMLRELCAASLFACDG